MKTTFENRPHAAPILSLCMLAVIATTLVSFSQNEELPINKEWDKQRGYFTHLKSAEETPSYYKHIWFHTAIFLGEPIKGLHIEIHALHEDTNPPYAVILLKSRVNNTAPFPAAIPKEMFSEGEWEKMKQNRLSDFATKWKLEIPPSPTMRLPISRTITSNEGKTIEGTVLAKSEASILYQRGSDNKKLTISFDKLSEIDKKWIQQTSNHRPRILAVTEIDVVGYASTVIQDCLAADYDVFFPPEKDHAPDLDSMTPQEIQSFDIIWRPRIEFPLPSEKHLFKGVILTPESFTQRNLTSKLQDGIKISGRTVSYDNYVSAEKGPELIKKALETAIKMSSVK